MKKYYGIPFFCAVLLALAGCVPELSLVVLTGNAPELSEGGDGIIIYSGREILNDREIKIVAKRAQQLEAVSLSGGKIVWESSNPSIVEVVDQTGAIRVGQSLGKKAVITAFLRNNPSVKAKVTFLVSDLR